jgi:MOSC domain-containing protein YiiM
LVIILFGGSHSIQWGVKVSNDILDAVVEVTDLRNPCRQLDKLQPGLMAATLARDAEGHLIRKAGIMGIVLEGGEVREGDSMIRVELPPPPHQKLEPV